VVPFGSILEQFGIGTEKLLVPEPTTEPNLFPTLRSWNICSQLRPHLDRTSSQSPGKRSPVEKPSSPKKNSWIISPGWTLFSGMPNAPSSFNLHFFLVLCRNSRMNDYKEKRSPWIKYQKLTHHRKDFPVEVKWGPSVKLTIWLRLRQGHRKPFWHDPRCLTLQLQVPRPLPLLRECKSTCKFQ
jgi:hypothetical protein